MAPLNNLTCYTYMYEDNTLPRPPSKSAFLPHDFDILCGRDKLAQNHTGNKRFQHIIQMNRERYQAARSRDTKSKIIQEILNGVRCSGGWFLKKLDDQSNEWSEVDNKYAHEKVSNALRSAKDPNRQRLSKTSESSKAKNENPQYLALLALQRKALDDLRRQEDASFAEEQEGNMALAPVQNSCGAWSA